MKKKIQMAGYLTFMLGSLCNLTALFGRDRIADFPLGFLQGLALVLLVTGLVCFCITIAQQRKTEDDSEE